MWLVFFKKIVVKWHKIIFQFPSCSSGLGRTTHYFLSPPARPRRPGAGPRTSHIRQTFTAHTDRFLTFPFQIQNPRKKEQRSTFERLQILFIKFEKSSNSECGYSILNSRDKFPRRVGISNDSWNSCTTKFEVIKADTFHSSAENR